MYSVISINMRTRKSKSDFWWWMMGTLLFSVCPLPAQNSPDASPHLRLLVPAYIYLDEKGAAEWEKIFSASRRVPIVAIVNPSNGPGNERLANYTKLFQKAEAANASLIGYVSTSYARRPLQDVERDVDRWIRFYPGIKGIFLDEQASGKEQVDYYKELYHYIRGTCDLHLVVTNPGTLCDENYFSNQASDVICLHEDDKAVANDFFPDWTARYPRTDVLVLPYGVKHQDEMEGWVKRAIQKKFGYIYVTDRDGDDPWDHLPAYWDMEVAAVQKVNDAAGM
jgi:hypothetical protein